MNGIIHLYICCSNSYIEDFRYFKVQHANPNDYWIPSSIRSISKIVIKSLLSIVGQHVKCHISNRHVDVTINALIE